MCFKAQRESLEAWLTKANSYVGAREDKSVNPISLGILFFSLSSAMLSTGKLDIFTIVVICVAISFTAFFIVTTLCLRAARSLIRISWIQRFRGWFFIAYMFVFIGSWWRGLPSATNPLFPIVFYVGLTLFTVLFLAFISRVRAEFGLVVAFLWVIGGIVFLILKPSEWVSWVYLFALGVATFLVATRLLKIWNKLPI